MGVFGLALACYTTLVLGVATARDTGLLKRVRGTPLPMPIYLGSWVFGAALVGFAAVLLMLVVAVPAFGVHIYARSCRWRSWCSSWERPRPARVALMVSSLVRTPTRRCRSRS